MTYFKVGDKVATDLFDATHGVVVYGPYPMASITAPVVLVELSDGPRSGECVAVAVRDAKPYTPTYAPGTEVVRAGRHVPGDYTVDAGPFPGDLGPFYVVTSKYSGKSVSVSAASLRPAAEAPKPARTYTYDGVTYDLDAKYRDRLGDVYTFTGRYNDGLPTVTCTDWLDNPDTLYDIARQYGPLTRV